LIVAIANPKGGSGKSTIAVNLATAFVLNGIPCSILDHDNRQQSAAQWISLRPTDRPKVSLMRKMPYDKFPGLVICDCGARDTPSTREVILKTSVIIVPVIPSQFDLWSAIDMAGIIKRAKEINKRLKAFYLLNQVIPNTKLATEILEPLGDLGPILDTVIHFRMAYKASISEGLGVLEHDKRSKASQEIRRLFTEIMQEIGKKGGA